MPKEVASLEVKDEEFGFKDMLNLKQIYPIGKEPFSEQLRVGREEKNHPEKRHKVRRTWA